MHKLLHIWCVVPLLGSTLTACTSMELFTLTAQNQAHFHLTSTTAKLRLTTDTKRVFATPNSDCVDLSQSGLINDERPSDKRDDLSFWSWHAPATKEFVTQDLGVKGLSIEQMKRMGFHEYGHSYISKDMEVNAGLPLTIFIPKAGSIFGAMVGNAIEEYGFGVSFVPQENRAYQLIIEDKSTTSGGAPGTSSQTTYSYRARLFDVTDGNPINITRQAKNIRACSK